MSASLWISRASPFPVGSIRPGRPTTVPVHHPGPGLPPCASLALHGSPGHGGGGDGWSTAGHGRVRRASLEGELKSRSVAVIAAYRRYVCSCEGYREVKHFERTDQKKQPHALTRCGCMARLDVEQNEGSGIWYVKDFVAVHTHDLQHSVGWIENSIYAKYCKWISEHTRGERQDEVSSTCSNFG